MKMSTNGNFYSLIVLIKCQVECIALGIHLADNTAGEQFEHLENPVQQSCAEGGNGVGILRPLLGLPGREWSLVSLDTAKETGERLSAWR